MPYTQEITRQHPALFVVLLDQSAAMAEPIGGSNPEQAKMMDELAQAINAWLKEMTVACAKPEGVRHYVDVAVIGYRTDPDENPIIESAFLQPELAQKNVCSIADINDHPEIRIAKRSFVDDETGEATEFEEEMPVWVEPKAAGGRPLCWALHRVQELVEEWISQYPESYPPIVLHYTSGAASDGDPLPYAEALTELETQDGCVLFFNCLLASTPADPCVFPNNVEAFPDPLLQLLFRMSSELPPPIVRQAVQAGLSLSQPGARGMACCADLFVLIRFLNIGCD